MKLKDIQNKKKNATIDTDDEIIEELVKDNSKQEQKYYCKLKGKQGYSLTLYGWAKKLNMSFSTLVKRVNIAGMEIEQALTKPTKAKFEKKYRKKPRRKVKGRYVLKNTLGRK